MRYSSIHPSIIDRVSNTVRAVLTELEFSAPGGTCHKCSGNAVFGHSLLCPWSFLHEYVLDPHPGSKADKLDLSRRVVTAPVDGRIKAIRVHRSLTQKQVAETIHMNVAYYASLERGTKNLTAQKATALARALGVDKAAFYQPVEALIPDP